MCRFLNHQTVNNKKFMILKIMKNRYFKTALLATLLGAISAQAGGDGWLTDYETALTKAKEENKVILIEFHGSDWCPPCIQLNKEVLVTDEFKAVAKKSLILVDTDFPRKTALPEKQLDHNNALAKKYGIQYFPTVLLVDQNGEVLDKMVGFPKGGVAGFIQFIEAKTASGS